MAKSRIVILEDDVTLSSAMKVAFERAGFDVFVSNQAEEVHEFVKKNPVTCLFVDCLLPGGSGVDFVTSLRKNFPPNTLDVVLMSGIFTDAAFVKDAIRSTQASLFLKKPFDIKDVLDKVKSSVAVVEDEADLSPRKALYLLFNKPKVSVREKRKTIEALEEIHGFDLPYIYSLMVETLATGHLNVVNAKGEVSGISFSNGKIVAVDIIDQETQLGKLLIESGYILPDDLKEGLNQTSSKKLGERLIHANLLSPHAFNIALANQMSIRLSRTIVDGILKINFVATEVELTHPHIDSEALSIFLHDWIASKISPDWLKAHYMQWGEYSLVKAPGYQADHPILHTPLIAHFSGFVDHFTKGQTLHQSIDAKKYPEETAYKALHLLLTKGLLTFGERTKNVDPAERAKQLKKLSAQFTGKNKLEIWDMMLRITAGTGDSTPQTVFNEFKKILGPAPDANHKELASIYSQLMSTVQEVFNFSQSGNREKMKEDIAKAEVEAKIKANSCLEEAKSALQRSQFSQAVIFLNKAISLDSGIEKAKLYLLWARLGQVPSAQAQRMQALKEIEVEIMQVPPEEKFDALYNFVMGLYERAKGDMVAARKAFEKANNIDNTFLAARRELALLNNQEGNKKDVFNRDLKEMVAGFFTKKK